MRHFLAIFIVVILVSGCSKPPSDEFGPPELRLVMVDPECPFSEGDIQELSRNAYSQLGIDPDSRASVSLNMFFACHNLESSWVVSSRIHLGIELASGAVAYYESPTFGSIERVGESGISVEDYLTSTEGIIDKALRFSVDPSDSLFSTRPAFHE